MALRLRLYFQTDYNTMLSKCEESPFNAKKMNFNLKKYITFFVAFNILDTGFCIEELQNEYMSLLKAIIAL